MNSAHSYSEGAEVPEDKTDNELIAQFMGYEKVTVDYFGSSFETEWQREHQDWMETVELDSIGDYIVNVKNNEWIRWKDVAYDTSWDWLMPVVGKISQIHDSKFKYDVSEIKQGKWPSDNEYMEVIALPLSTPISDVYEEVVKFIKWYNLESLKNKPI